MPCGGHVESHPLFAARRCGRTIDQAIGELGLVSLENLQCAQHLVCAIDNELPGSQQQDQRLPDQLVRQVVAGSQNPIQFSSIIDTTPMKPGRSTYRDSMSVMAFADCLTSSCMM